MKISTKKNDPFRVNWINKSQNWAETGQNPVKILPKRAGKILKNSPERGSRDPWASRAGLERIPTNNATIKSWKAIVKATRQHNKVS